LSLRKVDSPRYTDFDWKTTLAEVIEETHEEEKETEPDVVEAEVEASETAGDDMDFPDEEIETAAKPEGESGEGEAMEDPTVDAQDTGLPDETGSDQEQDEPVKEAEGQGASAKNQ
jgi:hypothetical protein